MSRYVLSPRAQADLDGIWEFTAANWGADQAEAYVSAIWSAVTRAANEPKWGRACSEIRKGYFKVNGGQHVIFYKRTAGGIDVVRILHASMDFDRHL